MKNIQQNVIMLDCEQLKKYEPNEYPLLFLDRVTECVPGEYAIGYKNFTNNEWFFPKHYKGHPIVPAAVQNEAMSQMLTVAILTSLDVTNIDVEARTWNANFYKEIVPGDRLELEARVVSYKRGICKGNVTGMVDGSLCCDLDATIVVPEEFKKYIPRIRN